MKRGDKVSWWSHKGNESKAIFVEYDEDYPKKYCILGIPLGVKGNRMTHTFRWPLSQVARVEEGRTMTTTKTKRGV